MLSWDDITKTIAERAGYDYALPEADSQEEREVGIYRGQGYRRFLNAHDWAFLRPTHNLIVFPSTTDDMDGVPVHSAGSSTITADTADTFVPAMVGRVLRFAGTSNEYTIASVTSGTVCVVSGDASGETANDEFTVVADGGYRLPSDHGGVLGRLYRRADDGRWPGVELTSLSRIHSLQERNASSSSPLYAAEDVLPITSGAAQRVDLVLYPIPSVRMTLRYRYYVRAEAPTSGEYPYGSGSHSNTILAACLAAMELGKMGSKGPLEQDYLQALQDSIRVDRRQHRAQALVPYTYDSMIDPRSSGYTIRSVRYGGA